MADPTMLHLRMARPTTRALVAPPFLVATFLVIPQPASAATCPAPSSQPVIAGASFYDVAARSPCRGWAVGYVSGAALVEYWNGTTWTQQTSADIVAGAWLTDVAPISTSNVWAVGDYVNGTYTQLIEHWNGTKWKVATFPIFLNYSYLEAAAATSPHDVWAAGAVSNGSTYLTLAEHWNGHTWKKTPTPNPGTGATFGDVAALTARNAWAVGNYTSHSVGHTLIEHWNGTKWRQVPSPNALGSQFYNGLSSVSAASAHDAWAVGVFSNLNSKEQTLTLHWNGTSWKHVKSPNPGGGLQNNSLIGVIDLSPTNAWAVGWYSDGATSYALVEHWNGVRWKMHANKIPGGATSSEYQGAAATGPSDVWWVGDDTVSATTSAYAAHCC